MFVKAHDYTCGGKTDAISKEMGYKWLQSRLSDSFRCDLIVSVAALPQSSNLGVGGSNPSERAKSSRSVPDTWVTVYSGDMGNTFAPKGFCPARTHG